MRSRSPDDGMPAARAGMTQASAGDAATGIVALGVCATRVGELERFLGAVGDDGGLAYVVVLDPAVDRDAARGVLSRLSEACPLPVQAADDGRAISAGHVYVADGEDGVAIDGERLRRVAHDGATASAPIDFFMRALASERGEHSVGVLLTERSADGSLGMRAIREAAGLTLADGDGARIDGASGPVADIIAGAGQLPARIIEHRRALARVDLPLPRGPGQRAALEQILLLLRAHTGHDFSHYKKTSLARRIERRLSLHQLDGYSDYVDYLRENTRELSLLFKELLIGVTRFFRDAEAWQALQQVLPALLEAMPVDRPLRAWVAGCSTGEEAYTLAIVLQECIEQLPGQVRRVQIFATDLDGDAIERARSGWFPPGIANDVDPARLRRFFVAEPDGYRICRDIRERVVFAPHNVFMDPPFTRLDLLVCRNLLIYLEPELQRKLFPLFHFCLNPDGILLLGSAETVGRQSSLFSAHDPRARLYRREADSQRIDDLEFPARLQRGSRAPVRRVEANLQQQAEQLLLQRFAPAAVLVNSQGDVLYINGRTGRYLEPAAGRANWNIYAMARKGLGQELAIALPRALREKCRIDCPGVEVSGEAGTCRVDLAVYGIDEPDALHGLAFVMFSESRQPGLSGDGVDDAARDPLQHELQLAREAVRTTREEMQSQQEELRSANEELQSTNEELQSANEELTTSKEEMQSLNEELQACNAELQAKLDELSRAESDIDNLFAVTDEAVLFLDPALRVRRYSGPAGRIFKLVPADVGRCLSDFVSDLDYAELPADVDEVLRSLVACDKQVPARDGRCYRVRIRPYRTRAQVIDGVVMCLAETRTATQQEWGARR